MFTEFLEPKTSAWHSIGSYCLPPKDPIPTTGLRMAISVAGSRLMRDRQTPQSRGILVQGASPCLLTDSRSQHVRDFVSAPSTYLGGRVIKQKVAW